jgi:long-chain acyl-CoA synthetase
MNLADRGGGGLKRFGPQSDVDRWVFDVDGCLIDSLSGTSLRPGARELLADLCSKPYQVLLWSAGGADYALERAQQFGLVTHADGFFAKEGRDAAGHYLTGHLPGVADRTIFVDDRPEDLADDLHVLAVSPYLTDDRYDRGLQIVARWAGLGVPPPPVPAPADGVV